MKIKDIVRKPVLDFLNHEIKPYYKSFDKAHNLAHYKFVTDNCLEYGSELVKLGYDIDLELAFVVGALHDIGIINGREGHAKSSARFVKENKFLNSFYSSEIVNIIADAVEDHSSHLEYEPRNIYGKIVADADRNNSVYLVFSRPVKYRLSHNKDMTREEIAYDVYDFVDKKFGRNGYVKYNLNIQKTRKEQEDVWELLDNKPLCIMYIKGIIDECSKGKIC